MRLSSIPQLLLLAILICCYTGSKAQGGLCPSNLDFEKGDFNGWECRAGLTSNNPLPLTGPIPGRHTIITPATAGFDPFGNFPTLCPNGSGHSVKLGNHNTGSEAESISYVYTIPSSLTVFSMLFYYAVVIESPGHTPPNQPRFQARIIDMSTNAPLPCVNFDFIADNTPGGFRISGVPGNLSAQVLYKSWTPISVNLNDYIGRTIKLEFVTRDCAQNGHAGYAYLDVSTVCNGAIQGSTICEGDTEITLTAPFGFQSYTWYTDLTYSTILATSQSVTLNPPPSVGTIFPVKVEPYPGFGCTDTLKAEITVSPKPVSDAGPDRAVCQAAQVQLGGPSRPGFNYLWTPTANGQVSNPIISNPMGWIPPNDPPTEFYVKTTDLLTGCYSYDTTVVSTYIVDTLMQLTGKTTYCTGDPDAGLLSVQTSVGAVQWYNNNTPIPGANGYTYRPVISGNYWAQLQQGGCLDSTRIESFTVNATPVSVAGPDANICTNSPFQLGAAAVPGLTYSWTPVASVTDPTISNPFAIGLLTTPTEFIVHTTDPASGCSSYDTAYVSGRSVDTLMSLTGKDLYCTGDPDAGTLTVANTAAAIQWYNGTTLIPGATGASYHPTASGTYWAELTQFGCTDSTREVIFTVNITPVSVAGPDASICANQPIQIGTAPNPAYTYSWTPAASVSDPTISNPFATVLTSTPVEFIVHTVDASSGCGSYDTVYIAARPIDTLMSLTGKDVYCTGDLTAGTLTVANTTAAIQWYNGTTLIPGATNPSYHPIASGTYWAQLSQVGCTDSTREVPFTINTTPVSAAGPDASICTNQPLQIGTAPNPSYTYSWTPAASVSDPTIANPFATVLVSTPVEFIVHTVDPLTGCNSYDTTYITARPVDTLISLTGKEAYCERDPNAGTLSVSGLVPTIQWYEGTTLIPGATTASYHPTVAGIYWAELKQFGCTDSTRQIPFAIHPRAVVSFNASNDTACITRNSFSFENTSTIADASPMTYLWKFSDGRTQTGTDATKSFLAVGDYNVKLFATSDKGCLDSTDMMVHVLPNGVPKFGWDSICVDRQIQFYNQSDEKGSVQVNYSWNFGSSGAVSTQKDPPPVIFTTPGKTDVTLKLVTLGCEQDTMVLVKNVLVTKPADGVRYHTLTVPQGSSQYLHARNFGKNYNWFPKEQLSTYTAQYTQFTASANDIDYTVEITDVHTCVTVDSVLIQILRKPGYYLPTAFTPNGDGLNDVLRPYLVGMKSLKSFSVFNRWGNLVFYTNVAGEGWDGTFKGVKQDPGVYVWILEYITNDDKKMTEKGTVTIIR